MNDQSVGKQSSSGSIFDSFSSTPAKPGNATPSLLDSVPSTAGADSIFDFGDDPFSSSAPLPVMTTTTGAKPPLNKSQSTPFDEPEPSKITYLNDDSPGVLNNFTSMINVR